MPHGCFDGAYAAAIEYRVYRELVQAADDAGKHGPLVRRMCKKLAAALAGNGCGHAADAANLEDPCLECYPGCGPKSIALLRGMFPYRGGGGSHESR